MAGIRANGSGGGPGGPGTACSEQKWLLIGASPGSSAVVPLPFPKCRWRTCKQEEKRQVGEVVFLGLGAGQDEREQKSAGGRGR